MDSVPALTLSAKMSNTKEYSTWRPVASEPGLAGSKQASSELWRLFCRQEPGSLARQERVERQEPVEQQDLPASRREPVELIVRAPSDSVVWAAPVSDERLTHPL